MSACHDAERNAASSSHPTAYRLQISAWARHFDDTSVSLRRSFCKPLIETLETHQWIYSDDEEMRQEFRNILETLGANVGGAKAAIAKLKSETEKAESQSSESP